MKKLKKSIVILSMLITNLSAHSLWINSFESLTHKPGHITVGLGWGHNMPIDDLLNSPNGKIIIDKYFILDPNENRTNLRIPSTKLAESSLETKNFDVYDADIGLQKIALKENSLKGVYKISAISKPTFYTLFIDKKERKRFKLKPKNEINDIKQTLMSVKYQALATSYLTIGKKWENPKPIKKGLEIIPKTDLSNIKVGDLVKFEVLFNGNPLNSGGDKIEYITANSPSFGQSENFYLYSMIKDGKAQIKVQSSGQWKINCIYKNKITKNGKLKELYGKADSFISGTTLTFNVK